MSTAGLPAPAPSATLLRRLLSLVYEALLLTAVVLLSGGVATVTAEALGTGYTRMLTQTSLLMLCPAYFLSQWLRSGQTLPMKTWRLRLETRDGRRLNAATALWRLFLAGIGYGAGGITVLWALFDRDRQFMHDRLCGTRIVTTAGG